MKGAPPAGDAARAGADAGRAAEAASWAAHLAALAADPRVASWCAQQREPEARARIELPPLARGALTLAVLCCFFACLYAPLAPVLLPALMALALLALVVAARARHRPRAPASAGLVRELGVLLELSAQFSPDSGHGPGRVHHRARWLAADGVERECALDPEFAQHAPLRVPGVAFRSGAHLGEFRALPAEMG
jgi:hypothetical protein